jgi:hypothetical protein
VRDTGGGVYHIEGSAHPDLAGIGLVIAIVHRPDGRRAFGATPVSLGNPRG